VKMAALVATGLLLACVVPSPVDAAERSGRTKRKAKVRTEPRASQVIGTITYDTGINAGFHPDVPPGSVNLNRIVGNRFNSISGGPLLMTGMVFTVTVFPANDGQQSVSILSAPNSIGTAMVLDYQVANLVANQFNEIVLNPALPVGSDFLGVFLGTFGASQPAGLLGMSDMATMGQGFHGVAGFYLGGSQMIATMIQAVPNRNAMLRVSVDIFTPVELLDFKIQ
jgi:hypothetical protein